MLELINLHKTYPCGAQAVRGVSLSISPGEALGLVGESGCGKSTLGKLILRLENPEKGQLILDGKDYTHFSEGQMASLRQNLQLIFQDSAGSLNPKRTVFQSLAEPLRNYRKLTKLELQSQVGKLLAMVGLKEEHSSRYPHELSGGQRQRVVIARALALEPRWVICDEPVSSLDVLIQATILDLLKKFKYAKGLSYLFISHDLAAVKAICERIAVMYAGEIIELLPTQDLARARHPYTQALLSAIPTGRRGLERKIIKGDPPNPAQLPQGCAYHPRCFQSKDLCRENSPPFKPQGQYGLACHYPL